MLTEVSRFWAPQQTLLQGEVKDGERHPQSTSSIHRGQDRQVRWQACVHLTLCSVHGRV